ncbi:hypothetical protein FOS14_11600 [Skermania sp. ID1734]|uniref:hypothetical protein n=1 Tax=Skermania sp. ID1734 TaxID=2597516 RepID=UPI00117D7383|nr:hypothetical protein [Skermania sp. ID1734]TSD99432.1 hypothetical protein FOS14_11600 [Skermania sp. ID1734]
MSYSATKKQSIRQLPAGVMAGPVGHLVAAAACLLGAIAVVIRLDGYIPDDGFITLRYAQNLVDGFGWIYNYAHPTTDAASAPLYTLALAGIGLIIGNVKLGAILLFLATTAISGYLAFALLRRCGLLAGAVAAAALLVINPWLLATEGMETSLFVCLLLAGTVLLDRGNSLLAAGLFAAATLVRADGLVFLSVAAAIVVWRERRFPTRFTVGTLFVAAVWAAISLWIDIPLLPGTLEAKIAQGRSGFWAHSNYVRGFFAMPVWLGFTAWAVVSGLLGLAGLAVLCAKWRNHSLWRPLFPFFVSTVGVSIAYAVVIRPPAYHWYFGPQLVAIALCAGVSVDWLATRVSRLMNASSGLTIGASVALAATIPVLWLGWRQTPHGTGSPSYVDAGQWIAANTRSDATVACMEIGILGWESHRDMVDYLGLLSANSVQDLRRGDVVSWLARDRPDYWVVHQPLNKVFEIPAASQQWVRATYTPVWTDGTVEVWKRDGSATPTATR